MRVWLAMTVLILSLVIALIPAGASDHSDAPVSGEIRRDDANITDLHAFTVGSNLVIAISTNPSIPRSASSYLFPSDVQFKVFIDTNTRVHTFSDPQNMGGTILEPDQIDEDLVIGVRFSQTGSAIIECASRDAEWIRGYRRPCESVNFFSGLRDDPFIRGPRQGRNVGAIVLEFPVSSLPRRGGPLLMWVTSTVNEFEGPFQDLAGRSLRSMFPENAAMDSMPPSQHMARMGSTPDVMIYDLWKPTGYPNGRALTDDVIDLVGDPRVLGNDAPYPSENDKPFLSSFPYLAEPHPPLP